MTDFIPQNPLETALVEALAPTGNFNDFLKTFVQSVVYVPSATYVAKDPSNFRPVLFDKNGEPHMLVYTARDRTDAVARVGPFVNALSVSQLLKAMPPGTGLIVNPDLSASFSMGATGLQRLALSVQRPAT